DTPPALESTPDYPIPPALTRIVDRCLEKRPEARFQSASDLAFAIEAVTDRSVVPSGSSVTPARRPVQRDRFVMAAPGVVAFAGVAASLWLWSRPSAQDDSRVYRASITLPPRLKLAGAPGGRFAISPDGRRLAIVASAPDGRAQLWIRPLNSLVAQPL